MNREAIIDMTMIALGQEDIDSFNNTEARVKAALKIFEPTRDELQSLYPWKFCTERASLSPAKCPETGEYIKPAFGYKHKYKLPDDFLRIYECVQLDYYWDSPQESLPPMEGGFLLSDHSGPLNIVYIRKVEDEKKWTPVFAAAYSALLAQRLCFKVQQSPAFKESLRRDFLEAIANARRVDALQTGSLQLPPSVFERSRMGDYL